MDIVFHPAAHRREQCQPITLTRKLAEVPVGNRPLAKAAEVWLQGAVAEVGARNLVLHVHEDAWLSVGILRELSASDESAVAADRDGEILAWLGESGSEAPPPNGRRVEADADSFVVRHPWHLLRINEILVGALRESRIEGEVSPAATIEGVVEIGAGTRILPGVFIEGNAVVGTDCKIGPNCYIRGNTAIGDGCHIGQAVEIKNSLLMNRVAVGHLSYCGDSILGEKVNFGAGTITANLRHDNRNQRSLVDGRLVDTGRRKLGTVVGDGVHTGIHTSIYPGRKLWPGTVTRPGAMVERDLLKT